MWHFVEHALPDFLHGHRAVLHCPFSLHLQIFLEDGSVCQWELLLYAAVSDIVCSVFGSVFCRSVY